MNSTDTSEINPYGYTPDRGVCFTFIILFGISVFVHLVQTFYFKVWYWIPTTLLAGAGEILGWAGRLWSTYNLFNSDAYTIQIVSLIIAPTPFIAAIFTAFGRLVMLLGPQYSRLTPRKYSRIFITSDILCLVIQALGGATASGANTPSDAQAKLGGYLALGGIALQLISLICFVVLSSEFLLRYKYDKPYPRATSTSAFVTGYRRPRTERSVKLFIRGLALATFFLFVRAIYRTIELADGWNGTVIHTQVYFNCFDGTMVFLAFFTMNLAHPGFLLGARAFKTEIERLALAKFPATYQDQNQMDLETAASQS
ncbi:hypothetical protein CERSUDRAFT_120916 [Gelatoporia subvermispora B]|uniref:RTA1-domain-containing protein n=1 Tax=Ceriporiopsis subvermispora (strain B) TaxID=914234 RepID=M2RCA9_CERS8|nr:hypothetical protein CERSUDRAFT_120916 [Gelatoporia subvermispora B]